MSCEANAPGIEVVELYRRFGEIDAVDGVSFHVGRGELLSLLGPNGAGKSTTIKILCGYLSPTRGAARILGLDVGRDIQAIQPRIGVCPQDLVFYDHLTVEENLLLFGRAYRMEETLVVQRANEMIRLVGLEEKRKSLAKNLSGGQKRRLNLVLAIIHDPDVLFLDEPTAGLDPQTRRLIWSYIQTLKAEHKTILLTTHYMDEADILSDQVAIIDHGQIIAHGTPEELKESIGRGDVLELKTHGTEENLQETVCYLESLPDTLQVSYLPDQGVIRITALNGIGHLGLFIQSAGERNVRVEDIAVHANSLESVFLELTGRALRE
jgi:ABC-2 type transport system ATP-binding protein